MNWFYSVDSEEKKGPCAEPEIIGLIKNGVIKRDSFVWQQGSDAWLPLIETKLAEYLPDGVKEEAKMPTLAKHHETLKTAAFDTEGHKLNVKAVVNYLDSKSHYLSVIFAALALVRVQSDGLLWGTIAFMLGNKALEEHKSKPEAKVNLNYCMIGIIGGSVFSLMNIALIVICYVKIIRAIP